MMRFHETKPGQALKVLNREHPDAGGLWMRSVLTPGTVMKICHRDDGGLMISDDPPIRREWPGDLEVEVVQTSSA